MNTGDSFAGGALTGDDAIMQGVNQALQGNAETARYPIDVAAQGTTVTLTGTVGSQDAKLAAEQAARGVPGVVDVTNELVVDGDGGGGLFGLGGDRDNDTGGGVDTDNQDVAAATGGVAIGLGGGLGSGLGSGVGLGSGTGGGLGAGLSTGFLGRLGDDTAGGSAASGETAQSRNADTEEQDMSQ